MSRRWRSTRCRWRSAGSCAHTSARASPGWPSCGAAACTAALPTTWAWARRCRPQPSSPVGLILLLLCCQVTSASSTFMSCDTISGSRGSLGPKWLSYVCEYIIALMGAQQNMARRLWQDKSCTEATCLLHAACHVEARQQGLSHKASLIVCPPTLVGHWPHEIAKFVGPELLTVLQVRCMCLLTV